MFVVVQDTGAQCRVKKGCIMKFVDSYMRYLMAFGQVRSGKELGWEDYTANPEASTPEWLDEERALAVTLGACGATSEMPRLCTPEELQHTLDVTRNKVPKISR